MNMVVSKLGRGLAALPLALALPAPLFAQAREAGATRLDLVAEAAVEQAPDLAIIGAGVVSTAPTATQATAEAARRLQSALAALRAAGVAPRDIRTGSIGLNPQYRYVDGKPPELTGYQATHQLEVRLRDLRRAGSVIDSLVANGVNQLSGPSFAIDDPAPLLDTARTKAMAQARARAELYARAAGLKVKRILSISESGGQAMPPPLPILSARAAQYKADTELVAGEQRLSIIVSVSFELD